VVRSTHAFAGVFPMFVAERVRRRVRPTATGHRLPQVSPRAEKVLMGLSRLDRRLLARTDLPFGSSIFVAGVKPHG
jgi:hypothetical protein